MNDKLREWICNTCKYPCTLIVHVEDCTPDSCPYSCERFEGWKLLESHKPLHETVEHWEKRKKEKYNNTAPVYVKYRVYEGSDLNTVNEDDWTEWRTTVMFWKDYENFSSVLEPEYIDWEIEDAFIANHHGNPEDV